MRVSNSERKLMLVTLMYLYLLSEGGDSIVTFLPTDSDSGVS